MGSTQIKKSKQWLTIMDELRGKRADGTVFRLPSFAREYLLDTVEESNDQGDWAGWKITPGPWVDAKVDGAPNPVLAEIATLRQSVKSGVATAQYDDDSDPLAEDDKL
jgi:hypothetical protein